MNDPWQTRKLGDVCDLITCGVAARPTYVQEGIPFLSSQNVKNGFVVWQNYKFISPETHAVLTKNNKPQRGDLLYTRVGSYGEAAVVEDDKEFSIFVSLTLIKPKKEIIDNYFLKYYLNSTFVKEMAKKSINGSGVGNLNVGTVRNFPITIPSIAEQRRIVKTLNEIFESISKAISNVKKNLNNSKYLFELALQKILLNPAYKIRTLGELCESVEYGSSSKSKLSGEIPVLRMGNIQEGRFNWDNLVYSDDVAENKKYLLKFNDVLFNRTNSPELVGKTAIYKGEFPAIFAGYLIRINRKDDLLNSDYLNYYLNSSMARDYGKTVVISSVNQANINGTKLKTYPVPTPTLSEQENIVKTLDKLSLETKKLEKIYQQKLADLEELRKSILYKAFNGDL